MTAAYEAERLTLHLGDCIEVMKSLPENSIDAIVCDPPYGLEFMGKGWDTFRQDDPGTNRHRGEHVGSQGETRREDVSDRPGGAGVAFGGGKHANTSRCTGCGKRDQFRNEHECAPAARWVSEVIDPYSAPPTSLAFQNWCRTWAIEAYRVLKPGGHIAAFGASRLYHRLASGIEDAGFEVRDSLLWLYGSGFPKSLDVGKAIDKRGGVIAGFEQFRDAVIAALEENGQTRSELRAALGNDMIGHYLTAGSQPAVPNVRDYEVIREFCELGDTWDHLFMPEAEREVVGAKRSGIADRTEGERHTVGASVSVDVEITAPATDAAAEWAGWGTALKPAYEPVVLGRKPLAGTVAATVLEYRTGALNIDGTRIGTDAVGWSGGAAGPDWREVTGGLGAGEPRPAVGRWPANVMLDEAAAALLDAQTGERPTGSKAHWPGDAVGGASREYEGRDDEHVRASAYERTGDTGGASRFFYTSKASRSEREAGLEMLDPQRRVDTEAREDDAPGSNNPRLRVSARRNVHPTVKPVDLMRWLCRLVTPAGGTVLDPFMGSGSTGMAALDEGFTFVGIEMDAHYLETAKYRITHRHIIEAQAVESREDLPQGRLF